MNSQEEREYFERHGWQQDLIRREWRAPDGVRLEFDEVVRITETRYGEQVLRDFVAAHGQEQPR